MTSRKHKGFIYPLGRKPIEVEFNATLHSPDVMFESPPCQHFALPSDLHASRTPDTTSEPGYPGPVSSPKPSGRNIPEAQRGDERVVIRSQRGTKERLAELMARGEFAKLGDLFAAALDALERELEK